jgi:hypothetical protein
MPRRFAPSPERELWAAAASRWRWRPLLPHPRRHPPWAGLPTDGETVDLAVHFLGMHVGKPPLLPGTHGGQRPGIAVFRQGTGAAPHVEPTPRLSGHRPLAAEATTVAHAGAAALLVFPMRPGLCHRRNLSMQMAKLILRFAARVNPKSQGHFPELGGPETAPCRACGRDAGRPAVGIERGRQAEWGCWSCVGECPQLVEMLARTSGPVSTAEIPRYRRTLMVLSFGSSIRGGTYAQYHHSICGGSTLSTMSAGMCQAPMSARFPENPPISVASSKLLGDNTNGPSVLRVPSWVKQPLGHYYNGCRLI